MTSHALKSTCCVSICRAQAFPAAMASFRGELATTISDARLSIRSFLVNIILPIRLVRRTAYFPRWYNGVLRCNAICTGPPPAVRGPARASAPALRFLGVSDRGPAFNRKVRTKSLCKCPVRLWLPCCPRHRWPHLSSQLSLAQAAILRVVHPQPWCCPHLDSHWQSPP